MHVISSWSLGEIHSLCLLCLSHQAGSSTSTSLSLCPHWPHRRDPQRVEDQISMRFAPILLYLAFLGKFDIRIRIELSDSLQGIDHASLPPSALMKANQQAHQLFKNWTQNFCCCALWCDITLSWWTAPTQNPKPFPIEWCLHLVQQRRTRQYGNHAIQHHNITFVKDMMRFWSFGTVTDSMKGETVSNHLNSRLRHAMEGGAHLSAIYFQHHHVE